jgi:hypothetical protein
MKDYILPFLVAFLVCGAAFLALDIAIMNAQGLTLIFNG